MEEFDKSPVPLGNYMYSTDVDEPLQTFDVEVC